MSGDKTIFKVSMADSETPLTRYGQTDSFYVPIRMCCTASGHLLGCARLRVHHQQRRSDAETL